MINTELYQTRVGGTNSPLIAFIDGQLILLGEHLTVDEYLEQVFAGWYLQGLEEEDALELCFNQLIHDLTQRYI